MYRSPFHLAGITEPVTNKKELQLARKKLLAELELSGGITIFANNHNLSRQDIIYLFDELDQEDKLTYHLAVFQDQALLQFLESAKVTAHNWHENPLYETDGFLLFVSPLFAESVNDLIRQCLKQEQESAGYSTIVHRKQLLLVKDVADCFLYARRFFLERKAELLVFAQMLEDTHAGRYEAITNPVTRASTVHYITGEAVTQKNIEDWCTPQQLVLLNALPDEHFGELRYDLANKLNNICVICDQAKSNYRVAYAALQIAVTIHCGGELNQIIRDNIEIIYGKLYSKEMGATMARPPAKKESDFSWKTVLFIVLILIRIAGCLAH